MRNRFITPAAVIFGLLVVSISAFPHHGNAEFDIGKRVTVKGTVTKWSWSNPHCFLTFDSKAENGSAVHWVVETQPPRSVTANGFSQYTFKPGDEVTVTLEPVKNGQPLGRMLEVRAPQWREDGHGSSGLTGEDSAMIPNSVSRTRDRKPIRKSERSRSRLKDLAPRPFLTLRSSLAPKAQYKV